MHHPPHVSALAAEDPLDPQPFGLGVNLRVEAFDHLVGGEQTEIAPFGGVGAPCVVQADFMQQGQVAHAGVRAGIGKIVAGGGHKEDLGPLPVEGNVHAHAGAFFEIIRQEFEHVLDSARLDAEVVSRPEAVGHRLGDPVDVAADKVQEFPADHRDLGLVDSIRAENGAAAAFRALVEVVEPFLEDIDGQIAGTGKPAEEFARSGKITAIDGPKQFGPNDRHIFRVAGSDIEVAFVRTGAAPDANVHEEPKGAILFQTVPHPFQDDLLPVLGEFPVLVGRRPGPGIREIQRGQALDVARVAPGPRTEIDGRVHPGRVRRFVTDLDQFFGFGNLRKGHCYSLSTGSPASFILSRNSSSYSS